MMKHIYQILLASITFVLCFTTQTLAESVWALVNDISDLENDDQVIIVAKNHNYAIGLKADSTNDIRREAIPIIKDGTFCEINSSVQIFTLNKSGDYFQFKTPDKYLATTGISKEDLVIETSSSNKTKWNISIEATGKATIKSQQVRIRYYFKDNSYFKCYTNEGQSHDDVVIYKLIDPSTIKNCIVTISVDGTEETETLRTGSSFTLPSEVHEVAGLEFIGWSTTPFPNGTTETLEINYPGETVTISDTITYYAVYGKKKEITEPTFIEIENEQSDWSGTYLIVCKSESVAFDGSLARIDASPNYKKITISNNQIKSDIGTDSMVFHINQTTGGYSILTSSDKYIYNTEAINQILTSEDPKPNIISYNENNGVYIKGTDNAKGYAIRYYNKSGCRFRYYPYSNNQPIHLYKLNKTSSTYAYYTTSLNIKVTANKYGYSTWYSAIPVCVPDGLKAYYCTIEEESAILHPITNTIPSFTGAILYSPDAATTLSAQTYTLSYTNATTQEISGNHLIGYTEDFEVNNGVSHYALNVLNGIVGFYVPRTAIGDNPTPESAFIAKAGKAYLSINPDEASISYAIKRIDETDNNIIIKTSPRCEMQIYDLFGRSIKQTGKGIYIINGNKVIF